MSKTSYEDKIEAIKRIKDGEASINGTARKLGIHSETLRAWIMWYNGHKEFKERSYAEGEIYMTKGRKTTQEERVGIRNFPEKPRKYALFQMLQVKLTYI